MRTTPALLALALLCSASAFSRSPNPAAPPMPTTSAPTAVLVEDHGLALHAQFDYTASTRALHVRYTIENKGDTAMAVFDRGDSVAVATHKLEPGAVPAPLTEAGDGALTLSQRALPLPAHAPTVPRIPLAARLDAGHSLEGAFSASADALTAGSPITRVRACIGVAAFSDELFSEPETVGKLQILRASFKAVARQRLLCTPWFDLASQAFAKD